MILDESISNVVSIDDDDDADEDEFTREAGAAIEGRGAGYASKGMIKLSVRGSPPSTTTRMESE